MIISIDLGYGYVKGINQFANISHEGNSCLFPSFVGPGHDRSIAQMVNKDQKGLDYLNTIIDGKQYFIGELAQNECRLGSVTLDDNKIKHDNTKILLATAAGLLTPNKKQNNYSLHLATGLPYGDFNNQKNQLEKMLREVEINLEFLEGPRAGHKFSIKFDHITTFIQGLAVIYTSNSISNLSQYEGENFLVIEPGYKTTEVIGCSVEKGKLKLLSNICSTFDIGMNNVIQMLDVEVQNRTKKRLSTGKLRKLYEKKKLTIDGTPYDFTNHIEESKKIVGRMITDTTNAFLGEEKSFLTAVFVAGGGGVDLHPYLKEFHSNLELVKHAQFANSYGYMKVAEMIKGSNSLRQSC